MATIVACAVGGAVVFYIFLFFAVRGKWPTQKHCKECGRGIFGVARAGGEKGNYFHEDKAEDCDPSRWYDPLFMLPYDGRRTWRKITGCLVPCGKVKSKQAGKTEGRNAA